MAEGSLPNSLYMRDHVTLSAMTSRSERPLTVMVLSISLYWVMPLLMDLPMMTRLAARIVAGMMCRVSIVLWVLKLSLICGLFWAKVAFFWMLWSYYLLLCVSFSLNFSNFAFVKPDLIIGA